MDQRCLPLGYLFLGKEPDPLLACDLSTCPDNDDYNHTVVRLTCGHTFHKGCLMRGAEQSGEHSYAMHCTIKCPVCSGPLQHHMQQLATTLNRWDLPVKTYNLLCWCTCVLQQWKYVIGAQSPWIKIFFVMYKIAFRSIEKGIASKVKN